MYKKVAMVEQFFDIIYSVHVEAAGETQLRGRAGKHCGQKRTYRAVSASPKVPPVTHSQQKTGKRGEDLSRPVQFLLPSPTVVYGWVSCTIFVLDSR